MKISSRLDYALSCLLHVADKYGIRIVSVKEIALRERIAPDYVERLLVTMKAAGVLKSTRGKAGGYTLRKHPDKITARDVVDAIDGNVLELVCFRKKGRRKKCVHLNDCKVRNLWFKLRESMESFLEDYTLKDLLQLRRQEKSWQ